ncbi:MAG: HlyC/CorC family transporter [Alphaproteobacteria bacterium]|nr:HlyC/CorC family transporter [Alphaproteobacteria bacterium]
MSNDPPPALASNPGAEAERPGLLARLRERLRGVRRARAAEDQLREQIEDLIEGREEAGDGTANGEPSPIDPHERALIANVLRLRNVRAFDAMVPRTDIIALEEGTTVDAAIRFLAREAHSRVPIYRETLDEVTGFVHVKDVIAAQARGGQEKLTAILRKPLFVAPSMPVLDLLLEMRLKRTHLALVVDEFGGIDGLVTIEDLVEEIVGDIADEHDEVGGPLVVERIDGTADLDGRLTVEDFESRFGALLTREERDADIETVAGLVTALAGRVPTKGEVITHPSGAEFRILDADPRRVRRLRLTRPPARPSAPAED